MTITGFGGSFRNVLNGIPVLQEAKSRAKNSLKKKKKGLGCTTCYAVIEPFKK